MTTNTVKQAMSWSFDIADAPKGGFVESRIVTKDDGKERVTSRYIAPRVILATKCGKVTTSHWLHDQERWVMLAAGEQPVAWMSWPEHPAPQEKG